MKPDHDLDALFVDLLFQHIHLFVIGDGEITERAIPLQKTLNRVFEQPLGKAGHHKGIVLQAVKSRVETGAYMFAAFQHIDRNKRDMAQVYQLRPTFFPEPESPTGQAQP